MLSGRAISRRSLTTPSLSRTLFQLTLILECRQICTHLSTKLTAAQPKANSRCSRSETSKVSMTALASRAGKLFDCSTQKQVPTYLRMIRISRMTALRRCSCGTTKARATTLKAQQPTPYLSWRSPKKSLTTPTKDSMLNTRATFRTRCLQRKVACYSDCGT